MSDLNAGSRALASVKSYTTDPLLERIAAKVNQLTADQPQERYQVRGLWTVNYRYRPNRLERDLSYTMVYAQTEHQGCAYADYLSETIDDTLLGHDARTLETISDAFRIAALDAVCAGIPRDPYATHIYDGTSENKAVERARIICTAVGDLARQTNGRNVLNIGVMGNFVPWLEQAGLRYVGADFDDHLVRNGINGQAVFDGRQTLEAIAGADLVLATGMTLTTGTLSSIILECQKHNVPLALFAATGAHFGPLYCNEFGVDLVVSEPQPQYMFQGPSKIEVYRK